MNSYAKNNLLYQIEHFLDQLSPKKLHLHFDQLDIFSFYQGGFLNLKPRKLGHEIITKTKDPGLMNMKVMDQIIFLCSLHCIKDKKSKMRNVPELLNRGHVEIEKNRFIVHYTIASPRKDRQLQFCFIYQKLQYDS